MSVGVGLAVRSHQLLAEAVHRWCRLPIRARVLVMIVPKQKCGTARAEPVEQRLAAQVHAKKEPASDLRRLVAIQVGYLRFRPVAALLEEQPVP